MKAISEVFSWVRSGLAGSLLLTAVARGDITNLSTGARIDAEAQVSFVGDTTPAREDVMPPDQEDIFSFNESLQANASKDGRRAKGRSSQRASLSSTANNLSFYSSISTEATATRTGDSDKDDRTGAGGSSSFSVSFRVDGKSRYTLGGSVQVQTNGSTESSDAQVELRGSTDDGDDIRFNFEAEDAPGKPRTVAIGKAGELKPGSYSLGIFALSTIGSDQSTSRASVQVSFTVSSLPETSEDGEVIRWTSPSGGSFLDASNWTPERVPTKNDTRSDTAVFGLDASYDVTLSLAASPSLSIAATDAICERVLVTGGTVLDLSGGTLTVAGTSLLAPSFVVTNDSKLNLTGGSLFTRNSLLSNSSNHSGEAQVLNAGTRWQVDGRLTVGGDKGVGKLFVANGGFLSSLESLIGAGFAVGARGEAIIGGDGSQWETNNLAVGLTSPGSLTIERGGAVNSEDAVIGKGILAGDDARVTVDGLSGTGAASSWLITGSLGIGFSGIGSLTVLDGGLVQASFLSVGAENGGFGDVEVSGVNGSSRSTLTISGLGTIGGGDLALFAVRRGALAKFENGTYGALAQGRIFVTGLDEASGIRSELRTTGNTRIFIGGPDGTGFLNVVGGAVVDLQESSDMSIGSLGFGSGIVTVEGSGQGTPSTLRVGGDLEIGGTEGGQGLLSLNGGNVDVTGDVHVFINGIVEGIGTISASQVVAEGTVSPGLSPGALTIDGNFRMTASGTLRAEISGGAIGTEHDQLVVTGNATFDGNLVLQFMNGFAPTAGDQFKVLSVEGATTSSFSAVQVAGLEPGFEFTTSSNGGSLTIAALNDGVALPTVSVKTVGLTKKATEKGRKPAALLIKRTGSKSAPLIVNYEVRGTAENGVDYRFLPGTVTIPPKKSAVSLKIQPMDDKTLEGNETIEVTILPGTDYSYSLQSKASVSLIDNERR